MTEKTMGNVARGWCLDRRAGKMSVNHNKLAAHLRREFGGKEVGKYIDYAKKILVLFFAEERAKLRVWGDDYGPDY